MERKPFENVKEVLEQRKESPSCTLDAVIYSCRQKLTRGSAGDMRGRARGLSDLSLLTCVVCFRSGPIVVYLVFAFPFRPGSK